MSKVRTINLGSTSTGNSATVPLFGIYDKLGVSVVGGDAVTFTVQGSIDGTNWTAVSGATTSDGTSMHSFTTGGNVMSLARVNVSANASTDGEVSFAFAGLRT